MLSTIFVWIICHSKKNSARHCHKFYTGIHVQCPLFFLYFKETWIFSTHFRKTHTSNLIKIRPVAAELFHVNGRTEGRTDRQTWRS